MRSRDVTIEDSYYIHDTPHLEETVERIKRILDAKYEPANLDEVIPNCTHLTKEQQEELYSLLKRHESLLDGTLGTWKGEDYNIELRHDTMPYHARAFPIPRIHEQTSRHEVDWLCHKGVLTRVKSLRMGSSYIYHSKKRMVQYDSYQTFVSSTSESNENHFQFPKYKTYC